MVGGFVLEMPSRRTNNFHESGRGLGYVTATIFGSTVGYPSDSLASCLMFSNTVTTAIVKCRKTILTQEHLLRAHVPYYWFNMKCQAHQAKC